MDEKEAEARPVMGTIFLVILDLAGLSLRRYEKNNIAVCRTLYE